jgi:hypothetical protein
VRRLLCAGLLVLLVAACGDDGEPEPVETPVDTPTPTPDVAPLTGMPVDDPGDLERDVLAVKVDNLRPARPQSGLEDADIVMVELVEGATRFIALYHSTDPGVVGPVRSGRLVDADLLPPFEPVFLISGAAQVVWPDLRDALPDTYEEGQTAGWRRDGSRRAPHNLYVTATEVWEEREPTPPIEQFWTFQDDVPPDGTDLTSIQLDYRGAGVSGWEWDPDARRWLRSSDGEAHESLDGDRLAADNVAVVRMQPTDRPRRPFEPLGEGEATVLREGQQFEARWRKETPADHIELLTLDGDPFPLSAGQTWMELLPTDGSVTAEPPGS